MGPEKNGEFNGQVLSERVGEKNPFGDLTRLRSDYGRLDDNDGHQCEMADRVFGIEKDLCHSPSIRNLYAFDPKIDHRINVFFKHISPVFEVISEEQFREDWVPHKIKEKVVDSSWTALLLAILSLAYRADEMYNKTIEAVSMELELLSWICLTQNNFIQNASKSGLQALLLITFIKAHRGLQVAPLARLSHRINEKLAFEEEREQRMLCSGVNTLVSLSFQLANPALEDWMPSMYEQKVDGAHSLSVIHFELDHISYSISQWSLRWNPQGIHNIAGKIHSIHLMLSNQERITQDFDKVNLTILQIRLYHHWHCLMRPFLRAYEKKSNVKRAELAKAQCLPHARKVLDVYYGLVLHKNEKMWWYLIGLGSFYAVDCALTLAKYSGEREPLLEMMIEIFTPLASQSPLCFEKLPELTEAMMNYYRFQEES